MAEEYVYDVFVSYRHKGYGAPAFRDTVGFLEFDREVQRVADELSRIIQDAPGWDDWPVITPVADERVVVKLPRL